MRGFEQCYWTIQQVTVSLPITWLLIDIVIASQQYYQLTWNVEITMSMVYERL